MEPNGDVTNCIIVITKITQALLRLVSRMMAIVTSVEQYNG